MFVIWETTQLTLERTSVIITTKCELSMNTSVF